MSSIGTGYDLSVSTYSPDGRIFQVEYASKAAENSGVAIGIRCKDGVVLAVEKLVISKLLVNGANRRIVGVDDHVGMASAGIVADGRALGKRARDEAGNYRDTYGSPIGAKMLAERVGAFIHAYTCYGSVRPFGTSTIIAAMDKVAGPQVYVIEPSGAWQGFRAAAVGKGRQLAKTELEKLNLDTLSAREAVKEAARIVYAVHDDNKDGNFELEMAWISTSETEGYLRPVPADLQSEAEAAAKAALEETMDED